MTFLGVLGSMGLGEYCGYDDDIYVVSAFYEFAGIKPPF
jgi:hypothetical protein